MFDVISTLKLYPTLIKAKRRLRSGRDALVGSPATGRNPVSMTSYSALSTCSRAVSASSSISYSCAMSAGHRRLAFLTYQGGEAHAKSMLSKRLPL